MGQLKFLGLVFAALLSGCAADKDALITQAEVERSVAGDYQLSWTTTGDQVDIFVASTPDAKPEDRTLLLSASETGKATVKNPLNGRPYFYLTPHNREGVWVAERLIPLEGGVNFRDLGGYTTTDGKVVKWGQVFRSGNMSELTRNDYAYLDKIGIKTVCDFRTSKEREAEPNRWAIEQGLSYWVRDYDAGFGDMQAVLTAADATPEKMKAYISNGYRQMHIEQAPAFRETLKKLANDDLPLAFNCSAGKDRTGGMAALILTLLNVPRDIVISDYLLSNKFFAVRPKVKMNSAYSFMEKLPRELVEPLFKVDQAYITAMLDEIDKEYGSVEAYVKNNLGLTDAEIKSIRFKLLY